MTPGMDADQLLDSMRAVLLVVLKDGTIEDARGGFGGFLGLDVSALPGTNVFEHVPPADSDELALYFIENADESEATIALPLPFRMSILDRDGFAHPVDIIPTGRMVGVDELSWTVLVIPVALNGSITRSLDLEMAGAPHDIVRTMLCEELRVDNASYTSRWVLIDLENQESPGVFVARPNDQFIADAVAADLESEHWRPWDGVPVEAARPLDVTSFPARMRAVMESQGWRRSVVAPVYAHDRLAAVFMLVGKVPEDYDALFLNRNVATRIRSLVRATSLLIERWNDQDRLRVAASTDELTGLYNRRELFARLGNERRTGALLYIDVDDFKDVNDRYGHAVGDEILVQLARRIESACRSQDAIGRVGGDEFVVVLPGAGEELAREIARRIADRVAEPNDLALECGPINISVSIGHALLDGPDPLDAADHAMLSAKRLRSDLGAASDPT